MMDTLSFVHTWNIPAWSSICSVNDMEVLSPCFCFPNYSSQQWRLKVYPLGNTANPAGICMYLECINAPDIGVQVSDTILSVLSYDTTQKAHFTRPVGKHLFTKDEDDTDWGLQPFVSQEYLNSSESMLKNNNSVNVRVEIVLERTIFEMLTGKKTLPFEETTLTTPAETLKDDLSTLLKNGTFADVTVHLAGGAVVKAHSAILSARSKVFATMLNQNMLEAQTKSINLLDIDSTTFRQLLEFIYTSECDMTFSENAPADLLILGDRFDIPSLCEQSQNAMSSTISVENACDLLLFADTYSASAASLREYALNFVASNMDEIQITEGFQKRLLPRSDLTGEMFQRRHAMPKRKRDDQRNDDSAKKSKR